MGMQQKNGILKEDVVLRVNGLKTYFKLDEGILKAVDGVDFEVRKNTIMGVIGESGCGKSVTSHSIMRTVQPPGRIVEGNIYYRKLSGEVVDLTTLKPNGAQMRSIRGREISMVFQEPMASLSPVHTIGKQMIQMLLIHNVCKTKKEAFEHGVEMLNKVGLSRPEQIMMSYPHQLSGGMCQRAMIAIALCCSPQLLIADEPTTALDVTVQANIIELFKTLQSNMGMSIIYITHDLGVIAELADEVVVMYLGRIVEKGSTLQIFKNPLHPYTRRLLRSMPMLGGVKRERLEAIRGNVPMPLNTPPQCGFCSRCDDAIEGVCNCQNGYPELLEIEPGHFVSCFRYSKEGGETR